MNETTKTSESGVAETILSGISENIAIAEVRRYGSVLTVRYADGSRFEVAVRELPPLSSGIAIVRTRTFRDDDAATGETVVSTVYAEYGDDSRRPTDVRTVRVDSCSECGNGLRVGEPVAYFAYEGLDGVAHVACVPEGSDVRATV